MINKIILASKSGIRKKILDQNGINCEVLPANVDEESVKKSLIAEKATPEIISKNLAELKANKISEKKHDHLVLGAGALGTRNIEIDDNGDIYFLRQRLHYPPACPELVSKKTGQPYLK